MSHLDALKSEDLDRLHRSAIRDSRQIRSLLRRAKAGGVVLHGGISRENKPRTAHIHSVLNDKVVIATENFDQALSDQIYLNFEIEGSRYFLAATQFETTSRARIALNLPEAVYQTERRNRYRQAGIAAGGDASRVELRLGGGVTQVGQVVDSSKFGLGVEFPVNGRNIKNSTCELKFLNGSRRGETSPARVCHSSTRVDGNHEWVRIGLSLREGGSFPKIKVDRRARIVNKRGGARIREQASMLSAVLRAVPSRVASKSTKLDLTDVDVVVEKFANEKGQTICAIVDAWGNTREATTVVIPPAWGRTKETLLPLAATIKETFRSAGKPIVVLRFDGTNRRGESYVEPPYRRQGDEYLGFRFSQASRDIVSVLDFLDRSEEYNSSNVVLATFSLASIEGRHVLASRDGKRISGWVSTVGMADLQTALKTISGGVDYAFGLLRGVRFGHHELVGVVADMDATGLDAIRNGMVFFEDAIDEMQRIDAPITWIHGRDDAWMSLKSVREIMSAGDISRRRLIEVPTGHQLRSSREALATFQLIAEEISEIAIGERLDSALPSLVDLPNRSFAERSRRPPIEIDLRGFWEDYLLGRNRGVGMELLTATQAYKNMMSEQVAALGIVRGQRVADLGAGTGEFSAHIVGCGIGLHDIALHEVDFVANALRHASNKEGAIGASKISQGRIVANLDVSDHLSVPLKSRAYDAVIASLVVSYLRQPIDFLREALRILRPGGAFVVSTLRRDADFSKLFVEGFAELYASGEVDRITGGDRAGFGEIARDFLNDASKILDLEEEGCFQFWELEEFCDLVSMAGFVDVKPRMLLGDPAQAIVIAARRPAENE